MATTKQLAIIVCFVWTSAVCHGFAFVPALPANIRGPGTLQRCNAKGNTPLQVGDVDGQRKLKLRVNRVQGILGCKALQESEREEQCLVPPDLDQAIAGCSSAVKESILSGRRGLLIDVLVPELDPSSRGYNVETMRLFCAELIQQLSSISLGNLRVYFQGLKGTTEGAVYLRDSNITSELVADGRLAVESLLDGALPEVDDSAVILVAPANTREEKVTREVRRLLSHAEGKVVLIINHRLDAAGPDGAPLGTLPLEFDRLEPAYFVEPLSLQAQPADGKPLGDDAMPPPATRIAVTRKYPGLWGIYAFEEEDQQYRLMRSQKVKPTPTSIMEVCKHLVKGKGGL